ncbi:M28 family metallopeptidase [Gloeobacter kilaueensis]|uniref:Glutamate carboxypeptidase II n=1 Tax=Gloeobacter kilaueensis (strain ATCC BAA-2537 / CCAP 1431/1 / ULC 316 / JS1) TaxID=1183438 RepID=U5QL55_GLOK1|nr:M28 family metallopeptidase [Gloeobacter kilaueensis]AGY58314.1 glutamate carboxypeptidase II [Gloeobacter kilaueensis JS1]
MFRRICLTGLCLLGFCLPLHAGPDAAGSAASGLIGFDRADTDKERALEAQFDNQLQKANLSNSLNKLAARPHHVGSAAQKDNAEYLASQFRSWGYQVEIERFEALFPEPKTRLLELVGPTKFKAKLREPVLKADRTSGAAGELPVYNAYSIDGDVTGELVYVNYGVPKDYEELERRGIDVKGKIVIARYGGSWRGIKPKVAAEHGAIGCIIYSDPKDDGYYQGDVYPKGAWRNPYGAQRGSVADMPVYPGDPLTPDVGATPGAKRLDRSQAATLTKIPVLPIAYADALPLLGALGGPLAPAEWRGALPIPYHLGAGPAKVHLKLSFDWKLVPVYDVIARLPGSERPDQWIIRGNHYDGWVFGANDPLSGAVTLLEEARALSELVKGGWRPKRTIVFALWDGEEPGLIGSTEWVETHAAELDKKAALYINTDSNARGFLEMGGSHSLEHFFNEVARDVPDPEKKLPVKDRLRAQRIYTSSGEERREVRNRSDLRLAALGSGSDYSPFLQHLGIASLNLGYGGEGRGGSYHSIYDSIDHFERFIDPGYQYGLTLAQTNGRLLLRAADAQVLPFEFTGLADTLEKYVKEVTALEKDLREASLEKNRQIEERTFFAVADPTETTVIPKPDDAVPELDFAPLKAAAAKLKASAERYRLALEASQNKPLPPTLDAALIAVERSMLNPAGLPRRPWYRHQFYAPGFYTGYGVKTLPGLREAIEERQWQEARTQLPLLSATVEGVAAAIDRASAILQPYQSTSALR